LLDVHEYELMQEKLDLLTDIRTSLNQLSKGEGISHEEARKKLLGRIEP
jgi:antitoxin YefM